MNIRKFIFILLITVIGGLIPLSLCAQEKTAKDIKDSTGAVAATTKDASGAVASAENSKNLGGFFAQTLQDALKKGKFFYPNGKSDQGGDGKSGESKKYKLNFNNAPIDQILKFITDMNNKVVMRTDQVQGQFTIINPNEVNKNDAMKIIDTAFMLKGITYVETDMMIIVLTTLEAKQKGVEMKMSASDTDKSSSMQHRVFELKYASPSQLREAIASLVSLDSNIIADDRTRTLVITDTVNNLDRLKDIINQLDKEGMMEDRVVKVYQLQYLDAREMAGELSSMVENIVNAAMATSGNSRSRNNRNVTVVADRSTNSLVISAPKIAITQVEEFIKTMDKNTSDRIKVETIPLQFGDATTVVQSLQGLAQSRKTNIYNPIVSADTRTNTIIIAAYEEDIKALKEILTTLDSNKSSNKETRVYPLVNADAVILKDMITQLLTGESNSTSRYSWYYRQNQQQDQARIMEDQRLNAIIVTAKPAEFPMIEELIKELDKPLPESKEEPRVFPVKNVRASDLAGLITQLFTQDQQNNFFYYDDRQQQNLTGLTGKIKILADPTTNSLIVIAGTPRAFEVVKKLVDQLDRLAPEFGTTRVFRLKNAQSQYLATQLNQLFREDQSQNNRGFFYFMNRNSQQQDTQFSQLVGNVRIVAETRTNSLLVSTNSQYFEYIEKLIEDLDKEISQILVEVFIVEIINTDENKLGIDWGGSIPLTVEGEYKAGINELNNSKAAIVSNAKMTAVLDYLANNQSTNVVARPNILTRDNQPGYVEVTTRVPLVKEISITNYGALPSISFENVGLQLTVTPHINDATRVTVNVDLKNGQVLDSYGLQVQGFNVPALSQRVLRTELSIENEETVVLSGILDTVESKGARGVPGLSKIPVVGNLFKSKNNRMSKTELVTFITPYILSNQADRNRILEEHKEQINMKNKMKISKYSKVKSGVKED